MPEEEKTNEQVQAHDASLFKKSMEAMVTKSKDITGRENDYWQYEVRSAARYTPKEIATIIYSGSIEEQRNLSRYYFDHNGYYRSIITYYSTLLKYAGVLIPNAKRGTSLSTAANIKRYNQAVTFIENLDLVTWFTNCAQIALTDGCYYGLILRGDKDGVVTIDLPSQFCRSTLKDLSGNDLIEFNLAYFDSLSQSLKENALRNYPDKITSAYKAYKEGKRKQGKWMQVPGDLGICFQVFNGNPYFLNIIPAILSYRDALDDHDEGRREAINKIFVQVVPHLTDGRLVFEPDEAEEMHNGVVDMLSSNKHVRVVTTYATPQMLSSNSSEEGVENVLTRQEQNIYAQAGVSPQLFATTGSGFLKSTLQKDTAFMMILANRFARFVSTLVTGIFGTPTLGFKYAILPITYYNEKEYIENAFKLTGSGYSILIPSLALGISQTDLVNIKELENKVLKLREMLIPLSSTYTQSAQPAGGADTTKDKTEGEGDEGKGDDKTQRGKAPEDPNADKGGRPAKENEDKKESTIQKDDSINN